MNHPHFYSPQDSDRVPPLMEIVGGYEDRELRIAALTSCHTATSGIDNRFYDYLKMEGFSHGFEVNQKEGWFATTTKQPIIVLHTQKVRAYNGDSPIDLNVIGFPGMIAPTRDYRETAKEAKDKGAIVIVPEPSSRRGLPLTETIKLIRDGDADAVSFSAQFSKKDYDGDRERIMYVLKRNNINPLSVTGSNHYKFAGTSYSLFDESLLNNFSIEKLKEEIVNRRFDVHHGKV